MEVGSASSSSGTAGSQGSSADALSDVNLDDFLALMIAELQNQDPLAPAENSEILQQVSLMREIGATSQMQETLEAVLLGQNLSSAGTLVGRSVKALDDDGNSVEGTVDRITVAGGEVSLHIGEATARIENVREILGASA